MPSSREGHISEAAAIVAPLLKPGQFGKPSFLKRYKIRYESYSIFGRDNTSKQITRLKQTKYGSSKVSCRCSRSSGLVGCAVNAPWGVERRPLSWRVLWGNDAFPARLPAGDPIAALHKLQSWQHGPHSSLGERKGLRRPSLVEAGTGDPVNTYIVLRHCSP